MKIAIFSVPQLTPSPEKISKKLIIEKNGLIFFSDLLFLSLFKWDLLF